MDVMSQSILFSGFLSVIPPKPLTAVTFTHGDLVALEQAAILRSVGLFVLAGLAEIGGGYLVWQYMRSDWPVAAVLIGAMILVAYGFIPPLQPASFGRVYAAYGGVFIVMAVLWGWLIDRRIPDHFEVLGAGVVLVGVAIIMFLPR